LDRFQIGYGLVRVRFIHFRFTSGRLTADQVWIASGRFGCRSFQFILQFGFHLVMDQFTSDVRIQISSSYFGCQFGYRSRLLGSSMDPGRSVRVSGLGSVLPGMFRWTI